MKFTVAAELFDKLPEACFGVVVARNMDNTVDRPEIRDLLAVQVGRVEDYYAGKKIKEAAEILPYREAMQTLGVNPNKFMCSIEALLSRVAKKKGLPHINAAVDLGNAVSLKHLVPLGAHDLASFEGDMEVRPAVAADTFVPFGETGAEKPEAGEFVYVSGHTVRTRRWIWRQSEHGKIASSTSDIFFPLDGFKNANEAGILAARDELARKLAEFFGCAVNTGFIDRNNRFCEL
ncbi:MAG: hypothetical protein LBM64_07575 [Deltaproteobacteria bacterium]|jgi:DNA/RNA-binding domain of Phe-tRNA-synthetase-like protein|nr:hypothetical protein [Deltaproteobacteria bacterium]